MNEIEYFIINYGTYFSYGIVALFTLSLLIGKRFKNHHSNWNTLIDDFNYSTEDFYQLFKKELLSQGVSGINISDISLHEGNIFSPKRRYVRVKWKEYQYDICAAPFGDGFFISWWLFYKNPIGRILISRIPFIGLWLAKKLYPITYYKIDTASMFMTYAQSSVVKVIDDITKEKGLRVLTESERKPILNDIFKR